MIQSKIRLILILRLFFLLMLFPLYLHLRLDFTLKHIIVIKNV